jgi:hypothetical protein
MAETTVTLSGHRGATLDLTLAEKFSAAHWWRIKESLERLTGGRPNAVPQLLADLFGRVPPAWRDAVARELLYHPEDCPLAALVAISDDECVNSARRARAAQELNERDSANNPYVDA